MTFSIARRALRTIGSWFDAGLVQADPTDPRNYRSHPLHWIPFVILHAGCLGVIWVGWSLTAALVAVAMYLVRMFAITAFYHRYFSHRTFRTHRAWQFVFAVLGASAVQRGPLWWAAQHRRHHAHSDRPEDPHSPDEHGVYWAHMGWLTARINLVTDLKRVRDLARFPELVFLNRFELLVPVLTAAAMYALGAVLATVAPGLGTSGPQMLVWGFFISTVALFHGTCLINSAAHRLGRRRYATGDSSRNSLLLALLTLGEGWHNNHHHYPSSVRQGFYWWEIDPTYYGLRLLAALGVIRDLRPVPEAVRSAHADRRSLSPDKRAA